MAAAGGMRCGTVPLKLWQGCRQARLSRASRQTCVAAARDQPPLDPHKVLQVSRGASRAQIRAAYYARIRELHPDVNPMRDTTAATVEVNLAWGLLNQGVRTRSFDEEEEPAPCVFDCPEGEPTCIFVNPFACNISPLDWRLLQDVVAAAVTDESVDPEEALRSAGVYFAANGAIAWVTPAQLEALEAELTAMEEDMSYDLTGYYVTDCLLRARFANNRVRYVRTERGLEVEL